MGCGSGDSAIYLAEHSFQVTGVDISPRAIVKAQHKADIAKVTPTFLVRDVTDLVGFEEPFDLVMDNILQVIITEKYIKS